MWIGGVRVVIFDGEDRVLMLRQRHEGHDVWMVPGGMIEEDESAEEAAVREVKEETGLDVTVRALLWHVEEVSPTRGQRFVNFFMARVCGGTLSLGMDPERGAEEQVMQEVRFMTREEIQGLKALYPEYLKDELWILMEMNPEKYNIYKMRRTKN